MYSFLLAVLVVDAFFLIAIVLLQAGKGGGLAAMGAAGAGTDSLFGSRQAATLLTRATWWAGGIFLALAFGLSLVSAGSTRSESILRGVTPTAPVQTLPGSPVAPSTGTQAPGALPQGTPAPVAPTEAPPAVPE